MGGFWKEWGPPAVSGEHVNGLHAHTIPKSSTAHRCIHWASPKKLTPRIPLALVFSGLAFISLVLEDSLSDRPGNPMSQQQFLCSTS